MINPEEAEKLANATVEEYVAKCSCESQQDVANVLMKLASVCGLGMCAVVGQEDAVARMQGTAEHISKPEYAAPWKRTVVQ